MIDIRVRTDFVTHPKTVKTVRKLGPEALGCLVQLWASVAMQRPTGVLSGWDGEDIEIAAGWKGVEGEFFSTISSKKTQWLDLDGDTWVIHNWEEHQPWVVEAPARSKKARKAAKARWRGDPAQEPLDLGCSEDAHSMLGACPEHARSNAPIPSLPEKKKKNRAPVSGEIGLVFDQFWKKYPKKTGKKKCKAHWKRLKPSPELVKTIMAAVEAQIEWRARANGEFRPAWQDPIRWLKGERWNDELQTANQPQRTTPSEFPQDVECRFCGKQTRLMYRADCCRNENCNEQYYERRTDGTYKVREPDPASRDGPACELVEELVDSKGANDQRRTA